MDRLTEEKIQNKAFDLGYQTCLHDREKMSWRASEELQAYKNTGLTPAEVAELSQAKHEFSRLQQENKQLKELLGLAVEDIVGNCLYCKKQNDCKSRKGSHKHCWQWQHSDKLKGMIEI